MYVKQLRITVSNKKITFRLLSSSDEKILTDFFLNLSDSVKRWYNPHPFDKETAAQICSNRDRRHKKIIGIYDNNIISYCKMYFGLRYWEKSRFEKRCIFFNDKEVCTLAPCVVEDWQGSGVSSEMMKYVVDVCKQYGKKYILLWGGVVIKNKRAINYYRKLNFKSSRRWLHPLKRVMSYDMYLEI